MSGIFVCRAPLGKPRCARCKRPFKLKHEGDRYGPKCARIVAAAGTGDARTALEGHTVIV
jgi:hypothetical protein